MWPVPGSEIVGYGSAELRKRKHENKTGGNWGEKGRIPDVTHCGDEAT